MAAISIILKAVDQFSSTITGLNQGFSLVGKALESIRAVADVVWSAVKAGADLAFRGIMEAVELSRLGGAFDEQRNQFERLATSYGVIGQKIIDTVKQTSANTLSEFDSIAIATRAVAAGFRGPDLETALTYVKRWSESTGESFASVAERVFQSLSSGRFSILRQMGLVIENGAGFQDVVEGMRDGLQRFGDTGFNSADKLDALTASQDDFWRKVGQAINQSKGYQMVLGALSDSFVTFVNAFDASPVQRFITAVVTGVEGMYRTVLAFGLSEYLKKTADEVVNFAKQIGAVFVGFIDEIQGQVAEFARFQRDNPLLSEKLFGSLGGVDAWTQFEVSLDKTRRSFERIGQPAKGAREEAEKYAAALEKYKGVTFENPQEQAAFNSRIKELAKLDASGTNEVKKLIDKSGIREADAELDRMIEKVRQPIGGGTQAESAGGRVTGTSGTMSGGGVSIGGGQSASILLAFVDFIAQKLIEKASSERVPMAVLATS